MAMIAKVYILIITIQRTNPSLRAQCRHVRTTPLLKKSVIKFNCFYTTTTSYIRWSQVQSCTTYQYQTKSPTHKAGLFVFAYIALSKNVQIAIEKFIAPISLLRNAVITHRLKPRRATHSSSANR